MAGVLISRGNLVELLALLLSGYSVVAAILLIAVGLLTSRWPDRAGSRWFAIIFLVALGFLQANHLWQIDTGYFVLDLWHYKAAMFAVAPAFFLFASPLFGSKPGQVSKLLHLGPVLVAPIIKTTLAVPLAFGIGVLYLAWLLTRLYPLRAEREHFRAELAALSLALLMAASALVVGLAMPVLGSNLFVTTYSAAVGMLLFLLTGVLLLRPGFGLSVEQAAADSYARSTLGNLDSDRVLDQLSQLMQQDELYADPRLDLAALAARLDVQPHQLSELINTRLGKGYSRYLREQRVSAAQKLLVAKPSMAVLAVGMQVGFGTQSNFYDAFREIVGTTPGRYRTAQQKKIPE